MDHPHSLPPPLPSNRMLRSLTLPLYVVQLYAWSPTTFHSVWNAGNCDMYVLKKKLSEPGSSPYVIEATEGDMPRSSIELIVETTAGEKRIVVLKVFACQPLPNPVC